MYVYVCECEQLHTCLSTGWKYIFHLCPQHLAWCVAWKMHSGHLGQEASRAYEERIRFGKEGNFGALS